MFVQMGTKPDCKAPDLIKNFLPPEVYTFDPGHGQKHFRFRTEANNMAKAGEKSVGGGKRGLKRKAAAEEPQEAAVAGNGAAESGAQPRKAAAFPPGFSISEIKNKQRRHLMFTRWKQQQRKVRARRRRGSHGHALARGALTGARSHRGWEGVSRAHARGRGSHGHALSRGGSVTGARARIGSWEGVSRAPHPAFARPATALVNFSI